MRVVRKLDQEIRFMTRAKKSAKIYGWVEGIELADARLRATKREKKRRIRAVKSHNRVIEHGALI